MTVDNSQHKRAVLAIASEGGHWLQLMRLKPYFDQENTSYISTNNGLGKQFNLKNYHTVSDVNASNKIRAIVTAIQLFILIIKIKPAVVISTGALPGLIALVLAKIIFKRKTVWIDSIANAEELSRSGKSAKKFTDIWLTQWPELEQENGPAFLGSVL